MGNTRARSDAPKVCSICGKMFEEYGHVATPINSGRCCNVCNDEVVIPARMRNRRTTNKPPQD
jgi:hypothetical protein